MIMGAERHLVATAVLPLPTTPFTSPHMNQPRGLTMRISLSMDLGQDTTLQTTPSFSHCACMAAAPALPPLPPTTNTMSMAHMSIRFTISLQRHLAVSKSDARCNFDPSIQRAHGWLRQWPEPSLRRGTAVVSHVTSHLLAWQTPQLTAKQSTKGNFGALADCTLPCLMYVWQRLHHMTLNSGRSRLACP